MSKLSLKKIKILGVYFTNNTVNDVIEYIFTFGGLVTVPAAPALINLEKDKEYRQCLASSDVVICDSGYMTLLWNLSSRKKVKKLSGLKFVQFLLERLKEKREFSNSELFLIEPTELNFKANVDLFKTYGITLRNENHYVAPFYTDSFEDLRLLEKLVSLKPRLIIINLAGGKQEKLGLFLKKNLYYHPSPAIVCTGAALSFLNGMQAKIPTWADRAGAGWLFRILYSPKVFLPRYLVAFKLILLFFNSKKFKDT